jgi:hypothetical protein
MDCLRPHFFLFDDRKFTSISESLTKKELVNEMQRQVIKNAYISGRYLDEDTKPNYCSNEKDFTPYRLEELIEKNKNKDMFYMMFFKYNFQFNDDAEIIPELNIVFYVAVKFNNNGEYLFYKCRMDK